MVKDDEKFDGNWILFCSFFTFFIHETLIVTCTFQAFQDVYSLCPFSGRDDLERKKMKKNLRTVNIKVNRAVKVYNSQENTEQKVRYT